MHEISEVRRPSADLLTTAGLRRDLGRTLLVLAAQLAFITAVLAGWLGKDLAYAPDGAQPLSYDLSVAVCFILALGIAGWFLLRNAPQAD